MIKIGCVVNLKNMGKCEARYLEHLFLNSFRHIPHDRMLQLLNTWFLFYFIGICWRLGAPTISCSKNDVSLLLYLLY